MLMQNFGMTNKEYYGMLWYFLEWSILGLQPRDEAAMLGVKTKETFLEEFAWK